MFREQRYPQNSGSVVECLMANMRKCFAERGNSESRMDLEEAEIDVVGSQKMCTENLGRWGFAESFVLRSLCGSRWHCTSWDLKIGGFASVRL